MSDPTYSNVSLVKVNHGGLEVLVLNFTENGTSMKRVVKDLGPLSNLKSR